MAPGLAASRCVLVCVLFLSILSIVPHCFSSNTPSGTAARILPARSSVATRPIYGTYSSVVFLYEETFAWELYRWRILCLCAALLIEALLIVLLLNKIAKRRRAQVALTEKELAEAQRLAGVGSWLFNPATHAGIWSEELYRIHGLDPKLPLPAFDKLDHLFTSESEKRFHLIANTAPVMIWMSSPDKLCNYFNQPWLEFTGRRLEAELGNGWAEGVHPDDLRKCLDTYTQCFDRREAFRMEYRLRRHDGEYRWVLDNGVPRFNGDNSFAGYMGCCMDISDLKQARATVLQFSGRLMRAAEEERARIARELHDDINQRLALLANGLQEAAQAAADNMAPVQQQALQELLQLTNEIASGIQHISHQLHPSKLHYLGLAATVRHLCKEVAQQHKIEVECIANDLPGNLEEDVSLNLFRVVQESLRNVVKHSHANHVKVELTWQSSALRLRVSDNGVGFDPENEKVDHGLGLISMRERLRSVGGKFSIWSKPSLGTQVEGIIPAQTILAHQAKETGAA